MPLYAGKHAICAFLRNMRNMLRSHVRYKPVSLAKQTFAWLRYITFRHTRANSTLTLSNKYNFGNLATKLIGDHIRYIQLLGIGLGLGLTPYPNPRTIDR